MSMAGILDYACTEPGCIREFGSSRGLELHRMDVHGKAPDAAALVFEKRCRFPGCDFGTSSDNGLETHARAKHGDVRYGLSDAEQVHGEGSEVNTCRICGCTDADACVDDDGWPCSWVEPDLCSSCLEEMSIAKGAVLL